MNCPACHRDFECHADNTCWCFSFPGLLAADESSKCLCSECLLREMARKINSEQFSPDDNALNFIASLGIPKELEEDIDYYINKDGNYEFNRWYLLRRSYCCNNSCKHCPY